MHLSVTLPEELLNRLRAGALDALLAPIHEPVERARQGVVSLRFKRARALLDVIGWQAGDAAEEVVIDMAEHASALYDALSYALGDALRDLREAERAQGCACASAGGLCGYAAVIEEEDLVRARSDPRVRRFHEEADALRAELDREAAEWSPSGRFCEHDLSARPLTSSRIFRIAYLLLAVAVGLSVAWAEGRPYILVGGFVTIALARIAHDALKHKPFGRRLRRLAIAVRRVARRRNIHPDQTR